MSFWEMLQARSTQVGVVTIVFGLGLLLYISTNGDNHVNYQLQYQKNGAMQNHNRNEGHNHIHTNKNKKYSSITYQNIGNHKNEIFTNNFLNKDQSDKDYSNKEDETNITDEYNYNVEPLLSQINNVSVVSNETLADYYNVDDENDFKWFEEIVSSSKEEMILEEYSDVDLSKNVPKKFLYKKQNFLDNYKNPCWYEKLKQLKDHGKLYCLPYFFLAGMPKCGTTDLFQMLIAHPSIETSHKEPHWWTRNRFDTSDTLSDFDSVSPAPLKAYLGLFRKTFVEIERFTRSQDGDVDNELYHPHIFGDGSASTLWDMRYFFRASDTNNTEINFTTAHQIKHILPNAKILVMLRDPTSRLFSDYLYFNDYNKSTKDFHARVIPSLKAMNTCILKYGSKICAYNDHLLEYKGSVKRVRLKIGMYAIYLQDWLDVYGKDQILVIRLEDYTRNKSFYLQRIAKFLDIAPYSEKLLKQLEQKSAANMGSKKDKKLGTMLPKTEKLLRRFYKPFNDKLVEILQDESYRWV